MWHPAKPLLENRVEFVHCIVIIMHCLPKLCLQSPCCFSKRPVFYSNAKTRVSGVILCCCYRVANGPFRINKNLNYFNRGSRTGRLTRSTTPGNNKRCTCPPHQNLNLPRILPTPNLHLTL